MKRTLLYKVKGQRLIPSGDHSGLVSGSAGYLYAKFDFDEVWTGCEKKAIFINGAVEYPARIIDGECKIPYQALTSSSFGVCVRGAVGRELSVTTNTFTERQAPASKN